MANEKRLRANNVGGLVEDNPLTNSATTLTSAGLAALPVIDTTNHAALVIDPDGLETAPEIVYVTAHASGAQTATIARAQEGSIAAQHSVDIPWIHTATVKDFVATYPDSPWAGDTLSGGPFDEEFERESAPTALPTGFAWVNQGTATYVEEYGAGHIVIPANSSSNFRGIFKTLPTATAYTVTAKVGWSSAVVNYNAVSCLCLRESATGKMYSIAINPVGHVVTCTWASVTSGASTIADITKTFEPRYWRIRKNSATSWDFLASCDGIAWMTVAAAVNVNTFFTTAPDQIGFGGDSSNASIGIEMACHWMRIR